MFPKEIIEILQKYQDNNSKVLNDINSDISDIIENLYAFNQNLAEQAKNMMVDKNANNNVLEIVNDSVTLRNYIESIKLLEIDQEENSLNSSTQTDNQQEFSQELSTPIFSRKVILFLVSENICSFCNVKLVQHYIHYQRKIDNTIHEKSEPWHKCPACKKLFVLDYDAEEFDFNDTNIILNKEKCNEIPPIDISSVIILKNTLKCSSGHNTRDILAQIPALNEDGNIYYVEVEASYCFDCDRFTVLKDKFDTIRDVVTCKVIDETVEYKAGISNQRNNEEQENDISILKSYGYNVQTKKNISEQQRHIILSSIIESGIMNRRQVTDLLRTNLMRKATRPDCVSAVQKWKDDIEFVNTYKTEELPAVVFDKIILKYSQTK